MHAIDFKQVDVFTTRPFKGNPVAVIMDASALSSEQMQAIAQWTNLSETTFVLPPEHPEADYRVRIFTPQSELPFAGHPTIGTAHALIEAQRISPREGKLIQQCAAGLIPLQVTPENEGLRIAFELPPLTITPLNDGHIEQLERLLQCPIDRTYRPALVDVGPRWIVAQARNAHTLLESKPAFAELGELHRDLDETGVTLFGFYAQASRIEVRSFAPACGVNEDPVCGSGNGAVAAFIRHHAIRIPEDGLLTSTQGRCLGRDGHLSLSITEDAISVGGHALTCIKGTINV